MSLLICAEMYQVMRLQHICELYIITQLQSMPSRELASTSLSIVSLLKKAKVLIINYIYNQMRAYMLTLLSCLFFKIFKILTTISVPKETCWYKICLLEITGDTRLARGNPSAFTCQRCSHRITELPLPLYPRQFAQDTDSPCHKEFFSYSLTKTSLAQPEAILSCPVTFYMGAETNPHLSTTSSQGVVEGDKVPLKEPLFFPQYKKPHLLQPLPISGL